MAPLPVMEGPKRRLPAREKGAHFLLVAASFVLVVAGMRAISGLALPLLIAIFLSILSSPLLGWLTRHRVPKLIAVAITVLSNILVVAGLLLLLGGSLNTFLQSLPKYQERFETKTVTALALLEEKGIDTSELGWLEGLSDEEGIERSGGSLIGIGSFVDFFTTALRSVASIVSMGFIVFLLMVFILMEAGDMPRKFEIAFGWKDEAMANFTRDIQRYLGIKTLVSLTTGLLVGVWLLVLGIEDFLLWGMIAFLLNYIPSIGSIIASVPAILLGWIDLGPAYARARITRVHGGQYHDRQLHRASSDGAPFWALHPGGHSVAAFLGLGLGPGRHAALGALDDDDQDPDGEYRRFSLAGTIAGIESASDGNARAGSLNAILRLRLSPPCSDYCSFVVDALFRRHDRGKSDDRSLSAVFAARSVVSRSPWAFGAFSFDRETFTTLVGRRLVGGLARLDFSRPAFGGDDGGGREAEPERLVDDGF